VITAELRKLRSVRPPWTMLAGALLLVVGGVSGILLNRADAATPDGIRRAVAHVGLVSLFSLVLGITAVAGEYRHRTITDAYLATPRRARVVLGKLVVYTGAGLAYGVAAAGVAVVTVVIGLALKGDPIVLSNMDIWWTLGGCVVWNAVFAAIGVGVGALITNLMGAVAVALAWLALVEGVVAQLVTGLEGWLPFAAGSALGGLPGRGGDLNQWQGGLVLVGYAVVFTAIAVATTVRRDVT
jgi:ABC-2 type transport system permease protein